jgi:hypothetical protein
LVGWLCVEDQGKGDCFISGQAQAYGNELWAHGVRMEWFKDEIFLNSLKDEIFLNSLKDEISEMTPKLMCKSQNIFADKATTGYLSTISDTDTYHIHKKCSCMTHINVSGTASNNL